MLRVPLKKCRVTFIRVGALILFCTSTLAQENLLGLGAGYNGAVNDPGFELRFENKTNTNWSLVPHFSYYPGFRNVHELYIGGNVNYYPFENKKKSRKQKIKPYVFGGISYNRWINSNSNLVSSLGTNNFVPQAGIGFVFGGMILNGFSEFNYHATADEGTVKVGMYINFKDWRLKKKTECP